jgi:nucleoid-associated protein YgaU
VATARRPRVGQVAPVATINRPNVRGDEPSGSKPNPRSQPGKPGVIFKRSDTPFVGDGTHVVLHREKGLTKRGFLDVPFRFQIPPLDDWSRSFSGRWTNFDVVGGKNGPAERSRWGGAGLRTVQFRTMFMDWHPGWGVWEPDMLEPIMAVRELERLARRGIIFELKIRNHGMFEHNDVNMTAVLTQGDVSEVSGEPDTRYITLSFQEYDELEVERKRRQQQSPRGAGPWSHTVVAGDTLYSLARHYYHAQSFWRLIAQANPGMADWAPSRSLLEWSKRQKRKRVKVPVKGSTERQGRSPNTSQGEVRL